MLLQATSKSAGDLDDFDPLASTSSTTTSSRTTSTSESTTSESSSAITDKSKKDTDDLKDLLGGGPAKEGVTDIFAKDRGSPDSVKELTPKKTVASKVTSRASSSGVGSVSTRSRSSSSSSASSSSEDEAETKKPEPPKKVEPTVPAPTPEKPEPETKKAEEPKTMSEMNGPQVKREKLPDGGEKITTTRQVKQADGSIKTMTESKTVYPETSTSTTTQKQVCSKTSVIAILHCGNDLFFYCNKRRVSF